MFDTLPFGERRHASRSLRDFLDFTWTDPEMQLLPSNSFTAMPPAAPDCLWDQGIGMDFIYIMFISFIYGYITY